MSSKKEKLMFESFTNSGNSGENCISKNKDRLSSYKFPIQRRRKSRLNKKIMMSEEKIAGISRREEESKFSKLRNSSIVYSNVLHSLVISLAILMSLSRTVESVPASVDSIDSKIKMFLESHCTMQNQSLEHEEFKSFMECGPSHGAGIVKNLGRIPEYKSLDTDQWARATKREIITQCEIWPKDKKCQETTFSLIEKCFEKDQKFIFYFMFALTDVICQQDSDLFIRFWQDGGDACLGNHIKTLKKDFSDCFARTSTVSNADVYKNYDDVMQCFRSQFDDDCFGDGATEVLSEIMAQIKRVYSETSSSASGLTSSTIKKTSALYPIIVLAGWVTLVSL